MQNIQKVCQTFMPIQSILWPTMVGLEKYKYIKMNVLRRLENAILRLVFANTLNASFTYTFFQLLYKHYAAFTFQKLLDFDNVMTQFYLNFFKFRKF